MRGLTFGQLDNIRLACTEIIPNYSVKDVDPIKAVDTRTGNCFGKAMVACGLIEIRHELIPSVGYSTRLQGTDKPNNKILTPRVNKNMAHIFVLVPESGGGEKDILGLDFNRTRGENQGMIEPYNTGGLELAVVDSTFNRIVPTPTAIELGLAVTDWRTGAQDYLHRLGREPLDIDAFTQRLV